MHAKANSPDERRRTPRYRVTFRLVCNDGRTFSAGTVLDLSMSGIQFRSQQPVELGSEVSLVPLGEAGELLFDVAGTVMRTSPVEGRNDRWNVGLEFVRMDDATRFALMRLMKRMPETPDHPEPQDTVFPMRDEDAEQSRSHMRLRATIGSARQHLRASGKLG